MPSAAASGCELEAGARHYAVNGAIRMAGVRVVATAGAARFFEKP